MPIISYQEWMTKTRSTFSRRSTELRRLDRALEHYHQREQERLRLQGLRPGADNKLCKLQRLEDIRQIHDTLADWIRSKSNYRNSVRNKQGTVELLVGQVADEMRHSKPEREAMAALERARDDTLRVMLQDSRLVSRSLLRSNTTRKFDAHRLGRLGQDTHKLVKDLVQDAFGEGLFDGSSVSQSAMVTAAGPYAEIMSAGLQELISSLKENLAEALPLAGTVFAFSKAVYAAGKIAQHSHSQCVLVKFGNKLPEGDARAAIKACNALLEREITLQKARGTRALASAGAGLANVLTAGGGAGVSAATSLANTIAALIERLYAMGLDYREAKKVNAMISAGRLGRDLFAVCPLVGAYYLVEAPTSDIALFFVKIGGPAWMTDVEQLKKHELDGVISRARKLVQRSRYQLVPKDGNMFRADAKPHWTRKFSDRKFKATPSIQA